MFVGHLALGFAAKRVEPAVNLGWFIAAVTAIDLLWPPFLLAGLEQVRIAPGTMPFTPLVFASYPWSHSLIMTALWGAALVGVARACRVPQRAALLLLPLVLSHWVLDAITHAPDLPLWPGRSPHLGLGLWRSVPATFVVEGALWLGGVVLYLRTPASQRRRPWALWSLVALTTALWAAGPWASPPPSARALAWFALIGWILIPWAAWADGWRAPPTVASPPAG